MRNELIEPEGWKAPKGYANGVLARGVSDLLFVAGQIGWDAEQRLVTGGFVAQFRQALENVAAVVAAADARPEDIVRLTIYVTDKRLYLDEVREIGAVYRDVLGKHFPAMALVQVADLLEEGAQVEIEATAVVRGQS